MKKNSKNWYVYVILFVLLVGYTVPTLFFSELNFFNNVSYGGIQTYLLNWQIYLIEGILILTLVALLVRFFIMKSDNNVDYSNTKKIALIGILSSLALILSLLVIPFGSLYFLEFEMSVVVIVLATIIVDYRSGILVSLATAVLIYIFKGSVVGYPIGQIAYFISAVCFITPIYFFIKRNMSNTNLVIGMIVGVLTNMVVMIFLNYTWITPVFIDLFSVEDFYSSLNMEEPDNFFVFIALSYGAFNLIKYVIVSVISFIVFKIIILNNKKIL